ncbi:MAG: GTP cyclohydrolase II [Rhodospirillaceae bacterium TMED8]|nr:GTP cyclohydrolase II [Magnetovibrio sp.]OUT50367.1 MAG: GTP cyclohydrolase II [Rhodospirillaceae bacterium TMED8]
MVRSTADILEIPASREALSLLSIDRSLSELRRGRFVAVRGTNGAACLAQAVEGVTPESLKNLTLSAGSAALLSITARRACVLNLARPKGQIFTLGTVPDLTAEVALQLADPLQNADITSLNVEGRETGLYDSESAAVTLTKLARLLPAALTAPITVNSADDLAAWAARHDLMLIDAGDVFQYQKTAARTLRRVSAAKVPLKGAEKTNVIAFRPRDGGLEHLAIVVGEPKADKPVLTRIHSECFTGDLLGSLRCDCGDQLRGAIKEISQIGEGVLLYLAQEGRGIGLVNKLRAYELQDQGLDTIDANEQLGFDADERIYLPAAQMLRLLGFNSIRLMTNNPIKFEALVACGVTVEELVPHAFPSNKHNEKYLKTKANRSGHMM